MFRMVRLVGGALGLVLLLVSNPAAAELKASDWAAWVNLMPPGPKSFFVVGSVTVSNLGQVPVLKPGNPGINPKILILDLTVEQKPGQWPMPVIPREARYEIKDYKGNYSQVTIRSGSSSITIDVQEVH